MVAPRTDRGPRLVPARDAPRPACSGTPRGRYRPLPAAGPPAGTGRAHHRQLDGRGPCRARLRRTGLRPVPPASGHRLTGDRRRLGHHDRARPRHPGHRHPRHTDARAAADRRSRQAAPPAYEPFPGAAWFRSAPRSPVIHMMGRRLVEEQCSAYREAPGPQWTEADRASFAKWQHKLGYRGTDADGIPGPASWNALRVPRAA
ncbi:peptidoglycan-binding protein [Streptomyces sp. I3(2020)]|nr:peptidoglycan-binding protein [Streptomyces sp. I3(2020)]